MTPDQIRKAMRFMTPKEREEFEALISTDLSTVFWRALPGPQSMAYNSQADVIGFGGAAGGGKTDLAIGKSLMQHQKIMILRREGTQLQGIIDRLEDLLGGTDGYNGQKGVWKGAGPRGVQIEFGSTPHAGDETKYQGRPHDLLVFDEAANFLESQVTFLLGWNRSAQGLKSQALLTFNPPTTAEGRWVIDFFGPWIDIKHPLFPTKPGVLRYCVTVPQDNGTSRYEWVEDDRPCIIVNGELVYDFDPADYQPEEIVTPQSRTFIPSKISDNPFLMGGGYLRVLQGMPEPLRSQMLLGDFQAGMTDDPWQVVPTAWVDAAMARWVARSPKQEMLSMGVDVARGGKDNTVIITRHKGNWFDMPGIFPGKETPDGPAVAGLVIAAMRDKAPIHIDVIGVGASPYDVLRGSNQQVLGVNVATASIAHDKSGALDFFNLRSELWWKLREELDPANDTGIALPPNKQLRAEICMPKWSMSGKTIKVESRDEIVKRLGRSPDLASALCLALIDTPKRGSLDTARGNQAVLDYDPHKR